jgi:hypothetical protein
MGGEMEANESPDKADGKTPRRLSRENWLDSESFAACFFLLMVVSLGATLYTGQGHWFARSGSLMTFGGLLRSGRALFRQSIWDEVDVYSSHVTQEELDDRERRNRSDDLFAAQFGLYMALLGTLVWGYGDLITALFALARKFDAGTPTP